MKLSCAVLAAIIDGRPHRVGDLLPYLRRRIDPTQAMKTATRGQDRWEYKFHVRPNLTVEQQIERGSDKILRGTFFHLRKTGQITVEGMGKSDEEGREVRPVKDLVIQLTEAWMAKLRRAETVNGDGKTGHHGSTTFPGVWKELRHAFVMGWITNLNPEWTVEDIR